VVVTALQRKIHCLAALATQINCKFMHYYFCVATTLAGKSDVSVNLRTASNSQYVAQSCSPAYTGSRGNRTNTTTTTTTNTSI